LSGFCQGRWETRDTNDDESRNSNPNGGLGHEVWRVILASAVGTMIEWLHFSAASPLCCPRNSIRLAMTSSLTSLTWAHSRPFSSCGFSELSLSLPYHIGNGVFGGLLPVIGLSVCAATSNIYSGLYYRIIVAGITFVIGSLLLSETHGTRIWAK
jgi:hypothetical protein